MKIQRTTTKAIFIKDKKIFMVEDLVGNWELPGGKVEFGESPKEALAREVAEEIGGKDIKIGKLLDAWSFVSADPRMDGEDQYHFVVLMYVCEADLSEIKLSNEHQKYAWVSFDKLEKLQMKNGYREIFIKYRDLLES